MIPPMNRRVAAVLALVVVTGCTPLVALRDKGGDGGDAGIQGYGGGYGGATSTTHTTTATTQPYVTTTTQGGTTSTTVLTTNPNTSPSTSTSPASSTTTSSPPSTTTTSTSTTVPASSTTAPSTSSSTSTTELAKKVFVCKFVGTPGVDERLQTGQNPISVSVNAIPNPPGPNVQVGDSFADAQGRSLVIAFDIGQPEPDVSECLPGGGTTTTSSSTPSTTHLVPALLQSRLRPLRPWFRQAPQSRHPLRLLRPAHLRRRQPPHRLRRLRCPDRPC